MKAENQQQPLSYSSDTRKKRRAFIWLIVAAVVLGSLWFGWRYLRDKTRFVLLFNQYRAMRHHDPEQLVVYEDDPNGVRALLATGRYERFTDAAVRRTLDEWRALRLPNAARGNCSLFLHSRRAPGGEERLVAVYIPQTGSGPVFRSISIREQVLRPASWSADPADLSHRTRRPNELFIQLHSEDTLTIYAGQPDPNDASHFTLRYRTTKGYGTIDGWLLASDKIKWEVRDGPAKDAENEVKELYP